MEADNVAKWFSIHSTDTQGLEALLGWMSYVPSRNVSCKQDSWFSRVCTSEIRLGSRSNFRWLWSGARRGPQLLQLCPARVPPFAELAWILLVSTLSDCSCFWNIDHINCPTSAALEHHSAVDFAHGSEIGNVVINANISLEARDIWCTDSCAGNSSSRAAKRYAWPPYHFQAMKRYVCTLLYDQRCTLCPATQQRRCVCHCAD